MLASNIIFMKYDVIIIGGGVIGCATLDRLSRYNLSCLLLEKSDDVAAFTSHANSGIVHAGYDCEPGTLKAKFNVLGNSYMWEDVQELDVPALKCGSIVVARKDQLTNLETLKNKAELNGVSVKILNREETIKIEKNVADEIEYSLYAPSAGIVSPYQLTIAYADRAVLNGGIIKLNSEVTGVCKKGDIFEVSTENDSYAATVVINCSGEYGSFINDLAGAEHYDSVFRRGDYFVIDNTERKNISTVIFPLPTEAGKGILVAPTADGNIIYGPTAIDTELGDVSSSLEGFEQIRKNVPLSYKCPAFNKIIRVYSGLRTIIGHDFIIKESDKVKNFIMAVGICSPGLTSAPAIARELENYAVNILNPSKKDNCTITMQRHKTLKDLSEDELNDLIKEDHRWGRIVCRCEKVTEAEIIRAIHSPLPAVTVDAVKRRTRAGMGRCQGGFCGPRVIEIIAKELSIPINEVKKGNGKDSNIALYPVKSLFRGEEK